MSIFTDELDELIDALLKGVITIEYLKKEYGKEHPEFIKMLEDLLHTEL